MGRTKNTPQRWSDTRAGNLGERWDFAGAAARAQDAQAVEAALSKDGAATPPLVEPPTEVDTPPPKKQRLRKEKLFSATTSKGPLETVKVLGSDGGDVVDTDLVPCREVPVVLNAPPRSQILTIHLLRDGEGAWKLFVSTVDDDKEVKSITDYYVDLPPSEAPAWEGIYEDHHFHEREGCFALRLLVDAHTNDKNDR